VALASSAVSTGLAIAGVMFFLVLVAAGLWAVWRQARQFPKGFDRTGWEPRRGASSWLATKFTWLSGARG
jgi:hypothetical protein